MGALYGRLPAAQIGIGYYESVGAAAAAPTPVAVATLPGSSQPVTIVSAPAQAPLEESAQPLTTEQRAAIGSLEVMGIFGAGCLATWAGYKLVQSLRRSEA